MASLRRCLVKYFNISRSEMSASSIEWTITNWRMPWGEGVGITTMRVRICCVVLYSDVVSMTKCRSVIMTTVCSVACVTCLDLSLDRIIPIGIIQWVNEGSTGWVISARTSGPRCVGVSTKNVTADLYDSDSGSLPIAVAVECGSRPAICLSMPTPHKPATWWTLNDWI